jgi:hypothetical protein
MEYGADSMLLFVFPSSQPVVSLGFPGSQAYKVTNRWWCTKNFPVTFIKFLHQSSVIDLAVILSSINKILTMFSSYS